VRAAPDGYTLLLITSANAINAAMFKMMAGLDLLHVPYRGAQVFPALLAGDVPQVYFGPLLSSIGYVRAGKLRALAVTAATRSDALSDLPTVAEFVPGYEFSFWTGIGAPRTTPAEIVDKLNKEINTALGDSTFKARLADVGGSGLSGSPADFGKLIAEETEKWGKVIRAANIKPE
jgi:tripartite-type tricarboxylate transporter receptor subunit TctC